MWRAWLLLLLAWPAWAVTPQEVEAGAAKLYQQRLADLRAAGDLDRDEALLRQARAIVARLARVAPMTLDWEVHVGGEARDSASSMAGGRLLLSAEHVRMLELGETELAMLLAHEMAHAFLLHNWKEAEEALRLDPSWAQRPYAELEYAIDHDAALMARLAAFNQLQEFEADREGLRLAAKAGYAPAALAGFFRKLAKASPHPNFSSAEHPSPNARWRAARELAASLR